MVQRVDAAVRKAVLIELATVHLDGRSIDLLGQGFSVESLGRPGYPQGLRSTSADSPLHQGGTTDPGVAAVAPFSPGVFPASPSSSSTLGFENPS